MKKILLVLLVIGFSGGGCRKLLEKDVELKLPAFQSQLVIESYIEANKPVQLSLTETTDYFGPQNSLPFVNKATVYITFNNRNDTLVFNPLPDLVNLKYFNFKSKDTIPLRPGMDIYVTAIDSAGRKATAHTTWLNPVPVDSIKMEYRDNDTTRGVATLYFKDHPNTTDYYRFRVRNLSDSNRVTRDFFTKDVFSNGDEISFPSSSHFKKGQMCELVLYHIQQDYYNFLITATQASNANGNPFAQPATITTNVTGGTGIFTVLPATRKVVIFK